ncbi:glycosyltransferase [Acidihalobacter ferrooxydans]|uniref:Glycosyl transferase n=1 Tax=Acidihalobacter ferrooxydans TaxID=1765967 RepID=A0A1P8UGZ0_9GAMM|nr:glycosyltransferase [Acidihalobacter ferrooxydans]APZ43080.1 glycosyl transferase [Acidihalobacter ferrooxydans]
MIWTLTALAACLIWFGVLVLPWQAWRVREVFDAEQEVGSTRDFADVTVLIPARDEAHVIAHTLAALHAQGENLRVLVIDDASGDDTAAIARQAGAETLAAGTLPPGWAGKLWALEQGRRSVETPLVLLLDADIALQPGALAGLRRKLREEKLQLVSLMAELRMHSFWERLLMPAFVYFFKLLYPFRLANNPRSRFAAAAGGCILLDTAMLERIGGFACLRDALIDDCTLAARVKQAGGRSWLGLSHAARSQRAYDDLGSIWAMVARTAFTQLHYSAALLLVCSVLMVAAFWFPLLALAGPPLARALGAAALLAMFAAYWPTLRYYRRAPAWTLMLPVIGTLYLAMTWSSALRYWRGERSRWKGRVYRRT